MALYILPDLPAYSQDIYLYLTNKHQYPAFDLLISQGSYNLFLLFSLIPEAAHFLPDHIET